MELKTVNFRFPKIVLIFVGINLLHMVLGEVLRDAFQTLGLVFFPPSKVCD